MAKEPAVTKSLSIDQRKEWALELFIRDQDTQKAIAEKVGVSEKTMSKWVNDGNWDKRRKTLLATKSEQIKMLYDILDGLNREAKAAVEDNDPNTNPNSDAIIKITNAIKKLETQSGIGEIIETGMQFIKFIQSENLELAKTVTHWFDLFIENKLKTN